MKRMLLYVSSALVLGALGFALAARSPSAAPLDTTTADTTTLPTTTSVPITTTVSVTTAVTTVPSPQPPPPAPPTKPKPRPRPRPKPKQRMTTGQTTTAQATAPAGTTPTTSTGTTTEKQRRHQRVTPVAAATPPSGGTFPPWVIAGFGLAALLIGSGVTGLLYTRGRR